MTKDVSRDVLPLSKGVSSVVPLRFVNNNASQVKIDVRPNDASMALLRAEREARGEVLT